jgi:hypothetical protein
MKSKEQLDGFSMTKVLRFTIQAGIAGWVLVLAAGCDDSFNPKGPYNDQFVLYSVLTTRSDSQFVRVFLTYDPTGHNPLENPADTYVRNATVTLSSDSTVTKLASVAIPRVDKSRYTDDIVGYLAHPYSVQPGLTYTLKVSSEKGIAEASMVCPGKGEIHAENAFVLKKPELYTENISSRIRLSSSAQGYLVRIFLEFETRVGDVATRHQEEIPRSVATGEGSYFRFDYPLITRRNLNTFEAVYFGLNAYKAFLVDVKSRYGDIKVTGATYILTQVDRNLYTYFNLANGFQDAFSIRTDLPDYTNIRGGLGVFGAMVEDSVYVDLRAFE